MNTNQLQEIQRYINRIIWRSWKGYGSVIFFEIGRRKLYEFNGKKYYGELGVEISTPHWWINKNGKTICHGNEKDRITNPAIELLTNKLIKEFYFRQHYFKNGAKHSAGIIFSDKYSLYMQSCDCCEDDRIFTIKTKNGYFEFCKNGKFRIIQKEPNKSMHRSRPL